MIDITKNVPLYQQLKKEILNKIKHRNFKQGDRILPLRKLCLEYNVSHITAEKAIGELVHEGILYKRQGMGTFVVGRKNDTSVKNSFIVGLAIYKLDFITSSFFSRLVKGINGVIYKKNCRLEYYTTNKEYDCFKQGPFYINALEANEIDGLLIGSTGLGVSEMLALRKFSIPIVLLGKPPQGTSLNYVDLGEFEGTCKATEYLVNLNHKRIGFISDPLNSIPALARIKAYKSILKKYHLKYDSKLHCKANYGKEVYHTVQYLLSLKSPPTAIITHDDDMAVEVIDAIKDRGLKVPDDISVIGFNDALNSPQPKPSLTTIRVPIVKMGKLAVEMLLKLMYNEKIKERGITLTPELIIRKSCRRINELIAEKGK